MDVKKFMQKISTISILTLGFTGCKPIMLWEDTALETALWQSLENYERHIHTYEDEISGYITDTEYPMYLESYAILYLSLYKHFQNEQYLNSFNRAVYYLDSLMSPSGLWMDLSGQVSPLYNFIALRIYLDAYKIFNDKSYLEKAERTVQGLYNYSGNTLKPFMGVNPNTLCAVYLFRYSNLTGDQKSLQYAENLFSYATSEEFLDTTSGIWYYNREDMLSKKFDGHSAEYALIQVSHIIENLPVIEKIAPKTGLWVKEFIPKVIKATLPFIRSDGTFYFNDSVYCSVDSASVVAYSLMLGEKMFGLENTEIIKNAFTTILSNQDKTTGAYYINVGDPSIQHLKPCHGDDVGIYISACLERFTDAAVMRN